MTDPLSTITTRNRATMQTSQADPAQVQNAAGGYTFVADDMMRLRRFLAMGVEGGTFYASEKETTIQSSDLVLRLVRERGHDVLDTVIAMSDAGATVKQQPLMFTLAALAGAEDVSVRSAAMTALPRVCRTASHLFLFASYVENFRGWGKALRRGVSSWYTDIDVDRLAYQVEKYGQRYGWSHGDLLRTAHPSRTALGPVLDTIVNSEHGYDDETAAVLSEARSLVSTGSREAAVETLADVRDTLTATDHDAIDDAIADDNARVAVYARALGTVEDSEALPHTSRTALRLAAAETPQDTINIITRAGSVSWEMVKSEHLAEADVWRALIGGGHVPVTALLKNLARLTTNGTIDPFATSATSQAIVAALTDAEALKRGRVHPMGVLLAAATYESGRSLRGSGTWTPVPKINTALNDAFPLAFGSIEPDPTTTVVLGVDVSGSMDTHHVAGLPLSCRDAAVALAQALAYQFPTHVGLAFTGAGHTYNSRGQRENYVAPFDVSPTRRTVDVVREAKGFAFGRTDCALPILHAMENNLRVDCFIILTDNETWAGSIHPHEALRQYRDKTGIPARMVTVAMQQNPSTIADPKDPLQLDVVGLDASVVSLVSNFARGLV